MPASHARTDKPDKDNMLAQPSRKQALENGLFIRALRQTGNVTMAARMVGMHRTTFIKRRQRFPGFAADMDGALASAQAALMLAGGKRPPEHALQKPKALRTGQDDIVVHRGKGRRIQIRRSAPGRMTKAAEQAFFRALSATANVRLSCAAIGFSQAAIYRRRLNDRNFAKEMQVALEIGYDRLNFALLERAQLSTGVTGEDEQAWREWADEENPVPHMTVDQVIQLLYFHRQTALFQEERRDWKRKRVNVEDVKQTLGNLVSGLKRLKHCDETGNWRYDHEMPPPELPPLDQVTGWSNAKSGGVSHNPDMALFGGWRIDEMNAKMKAEGIERPGRRNGHDIWREKVEKRRGKNDCNSL